ALLRGRAASARTPSADSYRVVREHRVHTPDAVDDLRDAQVDRDAAERDRVRPVDPELALHHVQHRLDRVERRDVEVLVEAECQPGAGDARDRRAQLELREVERQLRTLDEALDRRPGQLTVALGPMTVSSGDVRAADADRQVERRARDQLLAVDVAAPP